MGKFEFIFFTQVVQLMGVCYHSEELVTRERNFECENKDPNLGCDMGIDAAG